jgi:hypothetical protein
MGGWADTITQDVSLTPAIAKKAIANMPKFAKDLNAYLKAHDMAPIRMGKTIGSTAHIEKDIKNDPEKVYGDIDTILSMPRIPGMSEAKNTSLYRKMIVSFIQDVKPPYIYNRADENGTNIIVSVGDDQWAQVDLVGAFFDTEDWTTHRMTPEHGLKGAFIGFLYAALGELLNISFGNNGTQVKHVGDELVSFRKIKVDKVHTITTDIGTFALDTFNYLYGRTHAAGSAPKIAPLLKANPGIKREEIKFADLANAVKGMAKSFELNNMYGTGDLKHVKDYDDFIAQLKKLYRERANNATMATKFDKAATPEAKQRAQETKDLLKNKPEELLKLL